MQKKTFIPDLEILYALFSDVDHRGTNLDVIYKECQEDEKRYCKIYDINVQ